MAYSLGWKARPVTVLLWLYLCISLLAFTSYSCRSGGEARVGAGEVLVMVLWLVSGMWEVVLVRWEGLSEGEPVRLAAAEGCAGRRRHEALGGIC